MKKTKRLTLTKAHEDPRVLSAPEGDAKHNIAESYDENDTGRYADGDAEPTTRATTRALGIYFHYTEKERNAIIDMN